MGRCRRRLDAMRYVALRFALWRGSGPGLPRRYAWLRYRQGRTCSCQLVPAVIRRYFCGLAHLAALAGRCECDGGLCLPCPACSALLSLPMTKTSDSGSRNFSRHSPHLRWPLPTLESIKSYGLCRMRPTVRLDRGLIVPPRARAKADRCQVVEMAHGDDSYLSTTSTMARSGSCANESRLCYSPGRTLVPGSLQGRSGKLIEPTVHA